MSTWAQWREAAKTPFKDGERVRMEGGKPYKARVPETLCVSGPPSLAGSTISTPNVTN